MEKNSMRSKTIGIAWGFFLCVMTLNVLAQDDNQFLRYFITNEYDSARVILETRIAESPDDGEAYYYLGRIHLAEKKHALAINAFRKYIDLHPTHQKGYEQLGKTYEDQGMTAEAIPAYIEAWFQDKDEIRLNLKIGGLLYKQQNYGRVIKFMNEYLAEDSTNMHAHYLMGRSMIKRGEFNEAINISGRAVSLDSTSVMNLLNLGIAYFNLDDYNQALYPLVRAAGFSSQSDEARYYLGQTLNALEDRTRAIHHLETCVGFNGRYRLRALRALLSIYYHSKLLKECKETADLILHTKTDESKTLAHYYSARVLSDWEQYKEAENAFLRTLKSSNLPIIQSTYLYQGLNAFYQKDYKKAIDIYKTALANNPQFAHAIFNLAIAYDDWYADKRPAIQYYKQLVDTFKGNLRYAEILKSAEERMTVLRESQFFNEPPRQSKTGRK